MLGRIADAHAEIIDRGEILATMPGLHGPERQAIQDALEKLRILKTEEERGNAKQKQCDFGASRAKLPVIALAIVGWITLYRTEIISRRNSAQFRHLKFNAVNFVSDRVPKLTGQMQHPLAD